jgi:hypothetical protein
MPETTTTGRQLRIAMVWNQTLLSEHVLQVPSDVVLGYGEGALFPLPEGQAARGDVTLLSPLAGGGYTLSLPQDARGAVWLAGQRRDVRELVVSTPTLTLGQDDYGVISFGAASYFFQQVPPAKQPKRAWFGGNGDAAVSFGLSLFVHVCVLLLMVLARQHFPEEKSLELPPDLIARFLVNPPPEDILQDLKKKSGDKLEESGVRDRDEGGGKKSKGDEGKVGKRDAKQANTEIEGENRGEVVAKVRGMGLLGALAGGDALKGALDLPNVSGMLSGLGSMRNAAGVGSGGRGLRGTGAGGGGNAEGGLLGGGGLGTGLGAGAGSGGGKGAGAAAGRGAGRGEAKVTLTPGKPQVSGYLSPEQIERVVRANQAALRYCYETELQRQRSLKGKLTIQWRVDRAGLVPYARVTSSTLNNASVEGCVVRQIKKWRFPKPDGGEVSVQFPFLFGIGS